MEMRPRYRGRSDSAEEVIYYPRSKKLHGAPSDESEDRNYHGDGEIRDVVEEVRHELLRETSPQSRQAFQFVSSEDIMEAGTTTLMGSSLGSSMMDGASTYGASTSLLDSYGNGSISLLDGDGSTSMMDGGGSLSLLDGESGITLLEKNAPRNAPRKVPENGRPRMRDFRETKQPPMRDFGSKKPPVRKSRGFDENSLAETTVAETTTVGLTTVETYESEDNVSDFDSSCFIPGFEEIAQDAQQLFCCGPHLEQVSNTSNSVVETAATELIHESILNQADTFFTDEQARTIGKTFSQVSLEFDDAGNRVVDMTTRMSVRNMCSKENVDPEPVVTVTETSTVPDEVTFKVRVLSKLNKKKSTKKSKKHSFLVKRKTSTKVEEQGGKKGMFGKLRGRFRKDRGRQQ